MNLRTIMALTPYLEIGIRNLYWRSSLLPNMVTKAGAWRRKRSKGKRNSPIQTWTGEIIEAMRGWGVREGDLLVVNCGFTIQSFMAARTRKRNQAPGASPDDVIDALLELVGASGTLAMPAIPSWPKSPKLHDRMVADVSDLVLDYDPAVTPASTGAVPNTLMRRPTAVRSLHPLNSMVAIGPLAEEMMRDNLAGDRPLPCGPTSSWNFCYQNDCKIVAMATDLAHSLTMIHLAEDLQGQDWPVRGWHRNRKFRIKMDGRFELRTVRERHPKWAMYFAERTLSKDLIETGICTKLDVDGVNLEMISGVEMINYLNMRNPPSYPYFVPRRARKAPVHRASGRKLQHCKSLRGFRALCAGPGRAILSMGREIFVYDYARDDVQPVCKLPLSGHPLKKRVISSNRMMRRINRYGVFVGCQIDDDRYLMAAEDKLLEVDVRKGECSLSGRLEDGRRPLQLTKITGIDGFDDMICYGDYGSNPQKGPMSIWAKSTESKGWTRRYTFGSGEVNHVHALTPDRYRNCVWILTGDYGDGAGFWMARNNFRSVTPICRGHQLFRACNCFPMPSGLLYATDSHLHPNSIRFLHQVRGRWESKALYPMAGSSIYACRLGQEFAFTTTVEPGRPTGWRILDMLDPRSGPGILSHTCDLVVGGVDTGFQKEFRWEVDRLPKRLFGFSTVHLPSVTGDPERFLVTGAGVRGHDETTEVFYSPNR